MTRELQLLATAATLQAHRRNCPHPFSVLGLLSCAKRGDASVSIALANETPTITIQLHAAPARWPIELVSRCVVPSIFCFGDLLVSAEGRIQRLNPSRFLRTERAATRILAEDIGPSESPWIEISFASDAKCWLSPPKLEEILRNDTWAGAPADQARRKVYVRCLANEMAVQQPLLDRHSHKETARIAGATIVMQASTRSAFRGSSGRVRHMGTGRAIPTGSLVEIPAGVVLDVDFEILFDGDEYGSADGNGCLSLARNAIADWIASLIREGACRRILELGERARAEAAQAKLESRRADLTVCDYVYHKRRALYRVPTNENQLVSLFLKLEACGALPFHIQVLEYTPKTGIDAIGHFRIGGNGIREMFAPIEFEHQFGSFIEHGHPISHTKLIVCWSVDDAHGRRLKGSRSRPWLRYLVSGVVRVPVVVVSKLPSISVENSNAADADS